MENLYKPQLAKIINIEELSPTVKIFILKLAKKFRKAKTGCIYAGQFVMAGDFGYGESTFGLASSPYDSDIKICVRSVGNVTKQLHRKNKGDTITSADHTVMGFRFRKCLKKRHYGSRWSRYSAHCFRLWNILLKTGKNMTKCICFMARQPKDLLFKEYPRWQKAKLIYA